MLDMIPNVFWQFFSTNIASETRKTTNLKSIIATKFKKPN